MDINTGNKLIAEFMGSCGLETKGIPNIGIVRKYAKYHTSWDWLMPVVEKIESIHNEHDGYYGVYISSNSCCICGTKLHLALQDLEGYGPVYYNEIVLDTKIESTWKAVIEFIQHHNQIKQP
jgi:hypothetical protein